MISRRLMGFLAAVCLAVPALLSAAAAREFTDSAGRIVVLPERIVRAMPASAAAEVLIYVVAPDKLIGWTRPVPRPLLPGRYARLPAIGQLTGPMPTAVSITRPRPDVIVDCGIVTPERAAFADQITQATGVPYILLDNGFDRTPAMLRTAGQLLGAGDRGEDLAGSAEHAINALRGRLLIQPATQRPRVYYARRPSGLETALPGSGAAAAIDAAGAINVAAALGPAERAVVTLQQLRVWNPEVILVQDPAFFVAVQRNPAWLTLAAVRNKKVFLEPFEPFGWIDDPPGVNRLIGLYWLSQLLYPSGSQDDLRQLMADFYEKFYGIKLSDKQIEAIAKTAGIPPSDTPHLAALPSLGGGPLPGPGTSGALPGGVNEPGRRGPSPLPAMPTTPSYQMPR